ncbi:family 20 glycosylhydrolase [Dictyobacter halimunensis]|uniref:family 20 glycosylhydrolase n=1 Tax=Dictyobacter halimunensis TaxID=3026934 RepID=UPI0030C73AF0
MKNRRVLWLVVIIVSMVLALISLPPLHLFTPGTIQINSTPAVAPELREWHGGTGELLLGSGSQIVLDPAYAGQLQTTARVFQQDLGTEINASLPIALSSKPGKGNFFFTLKTADGGIGNEGYILGIDASVTINAHTTNGIFYGTRSILQMVRASFNHMSLPKGHARDYPRYQERGFMLDVGRKFVPLAVLEDYIRLMSWYKFNDFQLHFNDNALGAGNKPDWRHQYAAFRLNSPAFPGLAAADGSYTEQQIQELEQVASAHAVTITPEIDTPAHDLALTRYRPDLVSHRYSKEFLDLSNPATYSFVNSLWNTFLPWFHSSQINIGMDEYNSRDADKYRRYINTYDAFLKKHGKTARMWGSLSQMPSKIAVKNDIILEDWDNTWANSVDMVKKGFKIINANDHLLYIVPHASYFNDFLNTRLLYERWEPYIFDLNYPYLNLQPGDPHLLGATFAVWNDKYTITSVADITARIEPAFPVLGAKMWTGSTPATSYEQFESMVGQIGQAPGTHF